MKMTEKEFLMNLLSIPSVNGENSEKDIAVYIQQFMVESGIDAQIQFIDEKHANVVAKLQGKSSEIIIWNGHMDTVPYGDEQLYEKWSGRYDMDSVQNERRKLCARKNDCFFWDLR